MDPQQDQQGHQSRNLNIHQFFNMNDPAPIFEHPDQSSVWSIKATYSKTMVLTFPGRVADVIYGLIAFVCPQEFSNIMAVDIAHRKIFFRTRSKEVAVQLDARLRGRWHFNGHFVTLSMHSLKAPNATVVNAIPDHAAAIPPAPAIPAAAVEAHHAAFGILGLMEGTAGGAAVFEELEVHEAGAALEQMQVDVVAPSAKPKKGPTKRARTGKGKSNEAYKPPSKKWRKDGGGNGGGMGQSVV
ncbi:hypothetical protein BDR26DRAFT_921183 [Obelidium mucronatum]|nr:hypothetical protein BDR26DRAFT_921183 [Obelidium mucronatum]